MYILFVHVYVRLHKNMCQGPWSEQSIRGMLVYPILGILLKCMQIPYQWVEEHVLLWLLVHAYIRHHPYS